MAIRTWSSMVERKSFDTFAPLGPYFVTKDEIKDPHNLNLWLKLNGQMMKVIPVK